DGIRDLTVTGVQTCALPILPTMLKGKTALVTGSTSGIGLGIAKALAQQGVNIVLNGFGDAQGPKAQLEALGVAVAYHGADMSQRSEERRVGKECRCQWWRER